MTAFVGHPANASEVVAIRGLTNLAQPRLGRERPIESTATNSIRFFRVEACSTTRELALTNQPLYQFDSSGALIETCLPLPRRQGKVRDVYDLGDSLLIVSTDRISAFDFILPSGIPGKGEMLTKMSTFWFDQIDQGAIGHGLGDHGLSHHLISDQVPVSLRDQFDCEPLRGRVMVAKKADVIPFECVVRGYLEGSGWKSYVESGEICGIELPPGLHQCGQLSQPIFTPATKAEAGHDENVPWETMRDAVGEPLASKLRDWSVAIYQDATQIASKCGLMIADTKFEFGICENEVILIDEVLTPDSSRFWAADEYTPGRSQRSFDKQFVREYLMSSDWDRESPPPPLPTEIAEQTAARYQEALTRLVS